jgi:hypothetical protein
MTNQQRKDLDQLVAEHGIEKVRDSIRHHLGPTDLQTLFDIRDQMEAAGFIGPDGRENQFGMPLYRRTADGDEALQALHQRRLEEQPAAEEARSMDLERVRQLRRETEDGVAAVLETFEKMTGTRIEGIDFDRIAPGLPPGRQYADGVTRIKVAIAVPI